MNQPNHTLKFERDSLLIKAYLWAWEGNPHALNFCKLFWGTLFFPLAAFIHGLFFIGDPIVTWIRSKIPDPTPRRIPTFEEITAEKERIRKKEEKGPNFFQRLLTSIGSSFDKIAAFCQTHDLIVSAIGYLILGLGTTGIAGGFVALWVFFPITMLEIFAWIVGSVVVVGGLILIAYYLDYSGKGLAIVNKIGNRFVSVGRFLATGYHAVKYRTCPAIVVDGVTEAKRQTV